jgi:hypothetical protein
MWHFHASLCQAVCLLSQRQLDLRSPLHLACTVSFHARFITTTSSSSVVHERDAHYPLFTKQRLGSPRVRVSVTRFATHESPEDSRRQVQLHITNASLSAFRHGHCHCDDPVLVTSRFSYSPRFLSYTCTHLPAAPASGRHCEHASHLRHTTTSQAKTALRLSPALTSTSACEPLALPLICSQVYASETVPPMGDTALMLGGLGRCSGSSRSNTFVLRQIDYLLRWTFDRSGGQQSPLGDSAYPPQHFSWTHPPRDLRSQAAFRGTYGLLAALALPATASHVRHR